MTINEILQQLADGATLEGPHWTEPVKVLAVKARGARVEVQAVGLHTKRLWNKLLKADDFDGAVKITLAGELAALTGNPTHFRLAAEAHRIRLAFQYDPHFAVSVSQVVVQRAGAGILLAEWGEPGLEIGLDSPGNVVGQLLVRQQPVAEAPAAGPDAHRADLQELFGAAQRPLAEAVLLGHGPDFLGSMRAALKELAERLAGEVARSIGGHGPGGPQEFVRFHLGGPQPHQLRRLAPALDDSVGQAGLEGRQVVLHRRHHAALGIGRVSAEQPGRSAGADEGDGAAAPVKRVAPAALVQVADEFRGAPVLGGQRPQRVQDPANALVAVAEDVRIQEAQDRIDHEQAGLGLRQRAVQRVQVPGKAAR
jgi:hypothetical protein